jgi:glutathione S-transferase
MFGATAEAQKDFHDNQLPKHLGNIERQLGDNDYFVGNKMSVADITVYDFCRSYAINMVPDALEKFPKLSAWFVRMQANDDIAAHESSERFKGYMKFSPIEMCKKE